MVVHTQCVFHWTISHEDILCTRVHHESRHRYFVPNRQNILQYYYHRCQHRTTDKLHCPYPQNIQVDMPHMHRLDCPDTVQRGTSDIWMHLRYRNIVLADMSDTALAPQCLDTLWKDKLYNLRVGRYLFVSSLWGICGIFFRGRAFQQHI